MKQDRDDKDKYEAAVKLVSKSPALLGLPNPCSTFSEEEENLYAIWLFHVQANSLSFHYSVKLWSMRLKIPVRNAYPSVV